MAGEYLKTKSWWAVHKIGNYPRGRRLQLGSSKFVGNTISYGRYLDGLGVR